MAMSKTFLFVDDSQSIREIVQFTLENEGYSVLPGKNEVDALRYPNGDKIDLIITDLHMPEMNGIELIREIRKTSHYQRTPIFFLTTGSQSSKKMEAKDAGATGWIIKPFIPGKLIAAINKVIR